MRETFQVFLMVPGLLLKLLGVYLSFRRIRWAYMRRFSRTVRRNIDDRGAASRIISHEKRLLSIPFRKLVMSML